MTILKTISTALTATILSGSAFAADLPSRKVAPVMAPVPVFTWTGFYVGLNAGYGWSKGSLTNAATPVPDAVLGVVPGVSGGLAALTTGTLLSGSKGGFLGGAQAGYNYQMGSLVLGAETDIQALLGNRASANVGTAAVVVGVPVTTSLNASSKIDYLGTLRARLGFTVTPTLLAYVTGGLAYGGTSASLSFLQTGTNGYIGAGSGSVSGTRIGWTLGGGVEWAFAGAWSAKLEYLHYDLGSASLPNAGIASPASTVFPNQIFQVNSARVRYSGDVVRVGLNYRFGATPGPVVAKY